MNAKKIFDNYSSNKCVVNNIDKNGKIELEYQDLMDKTEFIKALNEILKNK